jgi:hypothetical protein
MAIIIIIMSAMHCSVQVFFPTKLAVAQSGHG